MCASVAWMSNDCYLYQTGPSDGQCIVDLSNNINQWHLPIDRCDKLLGKLWLKIAAVNHASLEV